MKCGLSYQPRLAREVLVGSPTSTHEAIPLDWPPLLLSLSPADSTTCFLLPLHQVIVHQGGIQRFNRQTSGLVLFDTTVPASASTLSAAISDPSGDYVVSSRHRAYRHRTEPQRVARDTRPQNARLQKTEKGYSIPNIWLAPVR